MHFTQFWILWIDLFYSAHCLNKYFINIIENAAGDAITVNDLRFREMLTEFLWPILNNVNLEDMWF